MSGLQDGFTFRRGLTVKNRMMMAPMTVKMSFYDGTVTGDELSYYALRTGAVGTVITGAANVQPNGKGWDGELSADDDIFLPGLAKLASTIKRNGTRAVLQLIHAGRNTNSGVLHGVQPVAPSAIASLRDGAEVPRALEADEIPEIIENFKKATERAIEAGFDGVELHGANTYLIQEFFSPHSNRRDDVWGGTREKRYKFINDLVDAVIEVVDSSGVENFIVGYRFSPEEFEEPGIRFPDTLWLVNKLADKKLDYLHISLRDYAKVSFSNEYQQESMLKYVHSVIDGRVPLVGVGDVGTKADVEEVLDVAEFVAIGRALLLEPQWVQKILNDDEESIRRELSPFDRDELYITNGIIDSLEEKMPERLKGRL